VNSDQARLGRFNMLLDIYRAYDVLIAHPRIDRARRTDGIFTRRTSRARRQLYAFPADLASRYRICGVYSALCVM